jgi:hypothetical protein
MLGVWYPFDLFEPSAGIPCWVSCLAVIAFLLGCVVTIWMFRGR